MGNLPVLQGTHTIHVNFPFLLCLDWTPNLRCPFISTKQNKEGKHTVVITNTIAKNSSTANEHSRKPARTTILAVRTYIVFAKCYLMSVQIVCQTTQILGDLVEKGNLLIKTHFYAYCLSNMTASPFVICGLFKDDTNPMSVTWSKYDCKLCGVPMGTLCGPQAPNAALWWSLHTTLPLHPRRWWLHAIL